MPPYWEPAPWYGRNYTEYSCSLKTNTDVGLHCSMNRILLFPLLFALVLCSGSPRDGRNTFPERSAGMTASDTAGQQHIFPSGTTIHERFMPPAGYQRTSDNPGSFASFLRNLPLKPYGSKVLLYNGREKVPGDVHVSVIDMEIGTRDLQQCADAIIRLRAEYLYSIKAFGKIHFNFTSGDTARYTDWIKGIRPVVNGPRVRWTHSGTPGESYLSFREYLDMVFTYAGTSSLEKELVRVDSITDVLPGDVFIEGGFPGHGVIVVDVVCNTRNGEKLFLIAQSYMPAQEIHILKNPVNKELNPWYETPKGVTIHTPEWNFNRDQLYRFKIH